MNGFASIGEMPIARRRPVFDPRRIKHDLLHNLLYEKSLGKISRSRAAHKALKRKVIT